MRVGMLPGGLDRPLYTRERERERVIEVSLPVRMGEDSHVLIYAGRFGSDPMRS